MGSTNEGADDVEVLESRINRDQSIRKPNPRRRGTVHLHQSSTPSFHHVAVGKYWYILCLSSFSHFFTRENGVFCVLFMPWFPSLSFPSFSVLPFLPSLFYSLSPSFLWLPLTSSPAQLAPTHPPTDPGSLTWRRVSNVAHYKQDWFRVHVCHAFIYGSTWLATSSKELTDFLEQL